MCVCARARARARALESVLRMSDISKCRNRIDLCVCVCVHARARACCTSDTLHLKESTSAPFTADTPVLKKNFQKNLKKKNTPQEA